jgi:hypothetical protein
MIVKAVALFAIIMHGAQAQGTTGLGSDSEMVSDTEQDQSLEELDEEDIEAVKEIMPENPLHLAIRQSYDTCEVTDMYKAAERMAKINTKKARELNTGIRTGK